MSEKNYRKRLMSSIVKKKPLLEKNPSKITKTILDIIELYQSDCSILEKYEIERLEYLARIAAGLVGHKPPTRRYCKKSKRSRTKSNSKSSSNTSIDMKRSPVIELSSDDSEDAAETSNEKSIEKPLENSYGENKLKLMVDFVRNNPSTLTEAVDESSYILELLKPDTETTEKNEPCKASRLPSLIDDQILADCEKNIEKIDEPAKQWNVDNESQPNATSETERNEPERKPQNVLEVSQNAFIAAGPSNLKAVRKITVQRFESDCSLIDSEPDIFTDSTQPFSPILSDSDDNSHETVEFTLKNVLSEAPELLSRNISNDIQSATATMQHQQDDSDGKGMGKEKPKTINEMNKNGKESDKVDSMQSTTLIKPLQDINIFDPPTPAKKSVTSKKPTSKRRLSDGNGVNDETIVVKKCKLLSSTNTSHNASAEKSESTTNKEITNGSSHSRSANLSSKDRAKKKLKEAIDLLHPKLDSSDRRILINYSYEKIKNPRKILEHEKDRSKENATSKVKKSNASKSSSSKNDVRNLPSEKSLAKVKTTEATKKYETLKLSTATKANGRGNNANGMVAPNKKDGKVVKMKETMEMIGTEESKDLNQPKQVKESTAIVKKSKAIEARQRAVEPVKVKPTSTRTKGNQSSLTSSSMLAKKMQWAKPSPILNNDPDIFYSSNSSFCSVCKESIRDLVPHFITAHSECEVIVSRISRAMATKVPKINQLTRKSSKKSNSIYHKLTTLCYFCESKENFQVKYWPEHILKHTGELKFRCTKCNQKVLWPSKHKDKCAGSCEQFLHYDFQENGQLTAFMCSLCNYIQTQEVNLITHLETQHEIRNEPISLFYMEILLAENCISAGEQDPREEDVTAAASMPISVAPMPTPGNNPYEVNVNNCSVIEVSVEIPNIKSEPFEIAESVGPLEFVSRGDELCKHLDEKPNIRDLEKCVKQEPHDAESIKVDAVKKFDDVDYNRPIEIEDFRYNLTESEDTNLLSQSKNFYFALEGRKLFNAKPWTSGMFTNYLKKRPISLVAQFKCMSANCVFTTNRADLMELHLQQHANLTLLQEDMNESGMDIGDSIEAKWTRTKGWCNCAYCSFVSGNPSELVEHTKIVHGTSMFQCSQCFYRAIDPFTIVHHFNVIHDQKTSKIILIKTIEALQPINMDELNKNRLKYLLPFQCNLNCKEQFYLYEQFQQHLQDVHSSLTTYQCSCGNSVELSTLRQHMEDVHHLRRLQCLHCPFSANDIQPMQEHMMKIHCTKFMIVAARQLIKLTRNYSYLDNLKSINATVFVRLDCNVNGFQFIWHGFSESKVNIMDPELKSHIKNSKVNPGQSVEEIKNFQDILDQFQLFERGNPNCITARELTEDCE